MDGIGGLETGALLLLIAIGWVLHLKDDEPAEIVLLGSVLIGFAEAGIGLRDLVPWIWCGTAIAGVGYIGLRLRSGTSPEQPNGRHARKG